MPTLEQHQSSDTTKLLLIGDSGCLAGNTLVSVTRGKSKSKVLTLKELYLRFSGKAGRGVARNWTETPTYLMADMGGYIGQLRLLGAVASGKKLVYVVKSSDGRTIRASEDHQFKTISGWKPLSDIRPGEEVYMARTTRISVASKPARQNEQERKMIYSIPFHPYGQANVVANRDYKRLPQGRLIIEAAMNGLDLRTLITILRSDPQKAALLDFLPPGLDIHHKDEDVTNDDISNLEVRDSAEHREMHHDGLVKASKALYVTKIESILEGTEEETYDLQMDGPEHNFVANGFVVHNSGKTGSLASLAKAGYNLRILDLDNGLDILKNLLTTKDGPYGADAAGRVHFKTLTEPMKVIAGKLAPVKASVWPEMTKMLMHWKDGEIDLGPVTTWGPKDVLVLDSFSAAGNAAFNYHRGMNGRLMAATEGNEWRRDIGQSQSLMENLLQMLYSEAVACNVIVIAHVTYVDDQGAATIPGEQKAQTGYPSSLGKALSPKIGRYFNNMLMLKAVGVGSAAKQKIYTRTQGIVQLKTSAPLKVKPEYDITTGLAEYFEAVRGG